MGKAPVGTTHFYEKDGSYWFYKKEGESVFYPDENNQWIEHAKGIDVRHDKWLEDNLIPYNIEED